jgi:transcriptional regulator with XRE-family HTH domain
MQLTEQPGVDTFAAALAERRRAGGLSQRALAKRCGLTPAYLSLLESGRRMPERPTVLRLAEALELSPEQQAVLLVSAGYAPPFVRSAEPDRPLSDVETLLANPDFSPEQQAHMTLLVRLYAQGLVARARAGKPLVSDLAAPWQQRILEAMQDKMAEDFESFRDAFMRPSYDL